jgi:hypothetical protein
VVGFLRVLRRVNSLTNIACFIRPSAVKRGERGRFFRVSGELKLPYQESLVVMLRSSNGHVRLSYIPIYEPLNYPFP